MACLHDDVIKWKHLPLYWPFVRGIHRSPINSPHKSQWRGAFMFSLICAWINCWVNNRKASDLRRHRAHYDVTVIFTTLPEPMLTYVTHHNYKINRNRLRYEVAAVYPRQIRWLSAILQYFHSPQPRSGLNFTKLGCYGRLIYISLSLRHS